MSDLSLPSLSLVPLEQEGSQRAPVAADAPEPFAWPTPPLVSFPLPACQIQPEPCEVHGRTGNVVRGEMLSFDLERGVVRVLVPPEKVPMPMRFAQIRRLVLLRPLLPLPAPQGGGADVQALLVHQPNQPYTLHLVGQAGQLKGSTTGFVEVSQGLFLFEPQKGHEGVLRCFVPRSAYERADLGEKLGEVLVDQQSVTTEEIDQALQAQQDRRQRRIGELLLARKIVQPTQLVAALDRQARMPVNRLGEVLVSLGYVAAEQMEQVLQAQQQERGRSLGQILLERELLTPTQLQLALARKMGFPVVDVAQFPLDVAVLKLVPGMLAERLRVLPLMRRAGRLVVAMEDTTRSDLIQEVEAVSGMPVAPALALPGTLQQAIASAYAGLIEPRHRPSEALSRPAPLEAAAVPAPAQALAPPAVPAVTVRQARLDTRPAALDSLPPVRAQAGVAAVKETPAVPPAAKATLAAATQVAAAPVATAPPRLAENTRTDHLVVPDPRIAPETAPVPLQATVPAIPAPAATAPASADAVDAALVRLLQDALVRRASDVHVEQRPQPAPMRVSMRREGRVEMQSEPPAVPPAQFLRRIKALAGLDENESRRPQQGRFNLAQLVPGQVVELDITLIPTQNGLEDLIVRLPARLRVLPLDEIGLSSYDLERMVRSLDRPSGLFLHTGPARSGNTSTLHALMAHLAVPERRVWTAEHRIELVQPELRQIELQPDLGWGHLHALRLISQADADVVLIDDLRQPEVARQAVEMALSGRLVIGAMPVRSAPEAITRLIEEGGVRPHDLADALCGVHAQHLVRRICNHCRMSRAAKDTEVREWLDLALQPLLPEQQTASLESLQRDWIERFGRDGRLRRFHSPGCPRCNHTGQRGRVAVHEMLVPSRDLRRLIRAGSPVWTLQRQALTDGLRMQQFDALEKMLAGLVSYDEVRRLGFE